MSKVIIRVSGTERMSNKEAIFSFLEIVRRGIIADQAAKKMRKSGESARSLAIEEIRTGGQLTGDDYIQQQITGRKPGKFMPPDAAMRMVRGIVPYPDKKGRIPTPESLAYIINRKIAMRGTDIFLGKRPGLDVRGIAEANEPTLRDSFIKAGKILIKTALAGALNQEPNAIRSNT